MTSEAGASGGQYVQLSGTPAAGAWIEFTLPNVPAGSYDVRVLYKANFNRGIVQASMSGLNQGSPCDQYAATATQQRACALGSKTLTADSSSPTIRFTVTGRNPSSAGFMMVIDQISLTATGSGTGARLAAAARRAPPARRHGQHRRRDRHQRHVRGGGVDADGVGDRQSGDLEAGASGGRYVQLSGAPAAGAWIQFTLPNVAAGTYAVVLYKANFNRGNRSGEHRRGEPRSPCDQYAAATQQAACSLGNKTLTATGNRTIRFTVTGKNPSSTGFMMVIDQISLTASGGSGTSWVGTWSGAPQLTEATNLPPASLSNSTLRQVVHVSVGEVSCGCASRTSSATAP